MWRIIVWLAGLLLIVQAPTSWGAESRTDRCETGKMASRFEPLEGGTLRDRRTGLIWSRCLLGQRWNGRDCGPLRHYEVTHSWDEARRLAGRSRRGGYSDWRLPSLGELRSLLYTGCGKGDLLDRVAFPGDAPFPVWSDTEFEKNPYYAWRIDFTNGKINSDIKETPSYVARLVRGRPWKPKPEKPRVARKKANDPFASDGIHDIRSEPVALLQRPTEALRELPRDDYGNVDWIAAMELGHIAPRNAVRGEGFRAELRLPVTMPDTLEMPPVLFPHLPHTRLLTCANCHPDPFVDRAGANPVRMDDIFRGEWCGRCHGRVAFSPLACDRCHRPDTGL
ncbi:MAG: hypothetical protein Kow006_25930 [Gammaproteobacteria bacterium]